MILCICRRVSDKAVRAAVDAGADTVAEVGQACGAGTGCGACHEAIGEIISGCPCPRRALLSPYRHEGSREDHRSAE